MRTTDIAGNPIALAYARSGVSGWTAAVFMLEAEFKAPLRRSLWASAVLGAVLLALAAALAVVFAKRIARPIEALADLATDVEVADLATPVHEVNQVGRALASARAASLLREREDLLLTLDQAQVLVRGLDGKTTACRSRAPSSRSTAAG